MNSTATVTSSASASASTSPSSSAASESRRNRRAMRRQQQQPKSGGSAGAAASSADSVGSAAGAAATATAAETARTARRNRLSGQANPSAAEVAAAFEDLGRVPSSRLAGNGGGSKLNGTAAGADGATLASESARNGSVRRSGNTILSSTAAAAAPSPSVSASAANGGNSSNASNAASGSAAVPSPQDVADEFVGRRRLQQQQLQQGQGQSSTAKTTPTRYDMAESSSKTPSTSNRRQQTLRVDTSAAGAAAAAGTSHSAASPDTHHDSVKSSELGSLASPVADSSLGSLAYSYNTSKGSKGSNGFASSAGVFLGHGNGNVGGFGDDLLSGQATNDIPATTMAAKMNGGGGVASASTEGERSAIADQQNATPQSRLQTPSGSTMFAPTLTTDSVDGKFDEGMHGGGSITPRYDDLSKLSSRYSRPDRAMAPVDEKPHLANPNGTSRSFDSYENKSHATAIVYGQHDTKGVVGGGGVGAITSVANGGGRAKQDGSSFSPTQHGNGHAPSQASVAAGGGRPYGSGVSDDEDTSQLTDDRSWSRSVNLRQQHLRAQGRDYDDDANSRGSRRRQKSGKSQGKESPGEGDFLLNADDLNHFKEQVDQPQVKAALGASAAVVAGAAIFGPAGVLIGAAAVGLGVGVMQMPDDQRDQMKEKATAAARQTYESAQIAADAMGTTCATACISSGVAEKIDPKFAKFVEDGATNGCGTTIAATDLVENNPCVPMEVVDVLLPQEGDIVVDGPTTASKTSPNGQSNGANESVADDSCSENQIPMRRRRKVACLRKGRIVPIGQIHSLEPSRQPKAWLDIMASANTSREEKDEAMEELSIFIKDKYTAHALLDEGILDSLLYMIACFFRSQGGAILKDAPDGIIPMSVRSDPDFVHAKKAANCCVNLGKAHCAIAHTEADDLLMSAYSNGAVPVERQLAQMLHEVPHHTSLPTTPTDRQTADGGDVASSSEVVFTLTELSLQHAERLAMSIIALSQGRVVL